MSLLSHLEPKGVFTFFEEICAIPHGSGNTKQISDYLKAFAKDRSLEVYQDQWNDVIIIKEATPGYEGAEPVILQGHMDMVCEKAPGCPKDMEREGLDLVVEGDTISAKDTTLGGDDGIALAVALALLDDESLPHPRLECVFTVDEETGMDGAINIDLSMLRGRRMLNLDSEEEGVFTVSCAGGNRTTCVLPIRREACPWEGVAVTISGLDGGHSGAEIHRGLGNACMLLGRALATIAEETEVRLISVTGGLKDNAIPREAAALLVAADAREAVSAAEKLNAVLKEEYRATDAGVTLTAIPEAAEGTPMEADATARIISFLTCAPNGVQVMSGDIPGLVQTSLNLGILTTEDETVTAAFCVRSSVETQKAMVTQRLTHLASLCGGTASVWGDYPGWAYRADSPLRELLGEVYRAQQDRDPRVEAIHAGLECGLFAGKLPGLDCVSIGPDLEEIHTTREKMHIASVQRLWALVTETLARMK